MGLNLAGWAHRVGDKALHAGSAGQGKDVAVGEIPFREQEYFSLC